MSHLNPLQFFLDLQQTKTTSAKLEKFVDILMKEKCFSNPDDARFMTESFYKKLLMSDVYSTSDVITYEGDVTLIKSDDAEKVPDLGPQYKLQEVILFIMK